MCRVLINEFIDCKFRVWLAYILTYASFFPTVVSPVRSSYSLDHLDLYLTVQYPRPEVGHLVAFFLSGMLEFYDHPLMSHSEAFPSPSHYSPTFFATLRVSRHRIFQCAEYSQLSIRVVRFG